MRVNASTRTAVLATLALSWLGGTQAQALVVPGTGVRVAALSDDFEDPGWGFDYTANVSSNGLWYGSWRGAPEILIPTNPPSGGLPGSTKALNIRTWEAVDPHFDNWDANNPEGQEDFVSKYHNQRFGRFLIPADYPSMTMRVHMPDITEWMGYPKYDLGFRAEVDSVGSGPYGIGKHYSSIWFYKKTNGRGYVYIRDSTGDYQAVDLNKPGPQWYTLGVGWDAAGSHFYFRQGVSDLALTDKIGDDTWQIEALNFHFITSGTLAKNTLGPDCYIDDVSVFAAGWAQAPSPGDGTEDAAEASTLSWTAGVNATSHAVYLGTTPELGAADLASTQSGTSCDPGPLDWGTTYYWRVDETNPIGVSTGLVWSFTTATPDLATNALPYAESFEAFASGGRPSPGEGWTLASLLVGDEGVVAVADDADVIARLVNDHGGPFPIETTHTRVLAVEDAVAASAVASTGGTAVTSDFMLLPNLWEPEDLPRVDADLQLALAFDSTGKLAVMHAATEDGEAFVNEWHVLSASPVIPEGGWVRVTILQDYTAKAYQVRLDGGDPIADAKGWSLPVGGTRPGTWYHMVNRDNDHLSAFEVHNNGYLDDLRVEAAASLPPSAASAPSVGAGSTNVALNVVLGWTAGAGATLHNVYFGTNAVLGAGDFKGGQSGTTFDPPGVLEPGTTYYWRVDEIGDGGTTEGVVWSFVTAPDTPPRMLGVALRDGQVEVLYTGNEVGAVKPYVMLRATNLHAGGWSPVDTAVPRPASPAVTNLWEQTPPDADAVFYQLITGEKGNP